jgi:hypothetical protein
MTVAKRHSRNGQVAKGVLQILEELPVVHVEVEDLPSLVGDSSKLRSCRSIMKGLICGCRHFTQQGIYLSDIRLSMGNASRIFRSI